MNAAFTSSSLSSNTISPSNPRLMRRFCPSHIKLKEPTGCGADADSSHSPACGWLYDTTLHRADRLYTGLSASHGRCYLCICQNWAFNSHPCKLSLEVNLYWAEPELIQHVEWELSDSVKQEDFYHPWKYIEGFFWIESNSALPCVLLFISNARQICQFIICSQRRYIEYNWNAFIFPECQGNKILTKWACCDKQRINSSQTEHVTNWWRY